MTEQSTRPTSGEAEPEVPLARLYFGREDAERPGQRQQRLTRGSATSPEPISNR